MYINPFGNNLHATHPERALNEQLKGWVYESHAWVVVSEQDQNHKLCKWCGAESKVDMVVAEEDSEKTLCPNNPVITGVIMQTKIDGILPDGGT